MGDRQIRDAILAMFSVDQKELESISLTTDRVVNNESLSDRTDVKLNDQQLIYLRELIGKFCQMNARRSLGLAPAETDQNELDRNEPDGTGTSAMRLGNDSDLSTTETLAHTSSKDYGRYLLLRPYARGGLGLVSVALDTELHREVALKEIRPDLKPQAVDVQRFHFEGELTGKLEHPGIVPVYGLGSTDEGKPYYAMRLIKGNSLRQELHDFHKNRTLSTIQKLLWLKKMVARIIQISRTINYAHEQGIVHRDLKPANVLIGNFGETLVVDWGLAKPMQGPNIPDQESFPGSGSSRTIQTQAGSILGTLAYMSPEQLDGKNKDASAAMDIFGLGATLYAVCCGHSPYDGLKEDELHESIRNAQVAPIREKFPWVPKPLAAICHKALARNPQDRYATAEELATELELWLAGEPVAASPENFLERLIRLARNHRSLLFASLAILLLALLGSFIANGMLGVKNLAIQQAQYELEANRNFAQKTVLRLIDGMDEKELLNQANPEFAKLISDATIVLSDLRQLQPDDPDIILNSARVEHYAANLARSENEFVKAEDHYLQASSLFSRFIAEGKMFPRETRFCTLFLFDLGEFWKGRGRLMKAKEAYEEGYKLIDALNLDEADAEKFAVLRGQLNRGLQGVCMHLREFETVLELQKETIAIFQKATSKPDSTLLEHIFLLSGHTTLAQTYRAINQIDDGFAITEQARQLLNKPIYFENDVAEASTRLYVSNLCLTESVLHMSNENWEEVLNSADEAIEQATEPYNNSKNAGYLLPLAQGYYLRASALNKLGRTKEALAASDKAESFLKLTIDNPLFTTVYQVASDFYRLKYSLANNPTGKAAAKLKALEYIDKAIETTPESLRFQLSKEELMNFFNE